MSISTKGVQVRENNRLPAGIHKAVVTNVEYGTSSQAGTPYIKISFEGVVVAGTIDRTLYYKPGNDEKAVKGQELTLAAIKHLGSKLIGQEATDALEAATLQEYAEKLKAKWLTNNGKSKVFWLKVSREDYTNREGGKGIVTQVHRWTPFAAEFISDDKQPALTYDPLKDDKPEVRQIEEQKRNLGNQPTPASESPAADSKMPWE